MKKLLLVALMATIGATAQTLIPSNTIKATNGNLLLQGTNSAGVSTQSVEVTNVGHIFARSASFNGADGVSAQKLTLSNGGTISGSSQVVTIDAVGNGNVVIKDQTTIEGNLKVNQTISSSQAIQTTGTGSISSAYNLSAASNKFNVAGDTGNVKTTGTISAANFSTNSGSFYVNGSNGNTTVHGVSLLFGGAYVGPRADDSNQPALTVNGQGAFKGISNGNQKITGVANGTAANDVVNVSQLNQAKTEAITTSNDYTDTKVGALETKVNTEVKRLDDRIDATNQNVTNLSNKVTTEVARVDSRIDATNKNVSNLTSVVEANKKEAADATAKVQSNLDKESKRLDMRIDTETQRVESKLNQRITEVDLRLNNRIDAVMTYVGNEFKAVNNRIEGLGASMVALSAAATSSVYNANKPTNLNIGTGFYGRSTAIAVGMSHFFNASTKVSVNWAQGSHTKNAVGIGAGFCF
jgi:hypothetical protein